MSSRMQDPTMFQPIKPQFQEQEQLKCPRCDSSNTKFCYYNNYNLAQPRHFCKNCKRYWTKGGSLRNIPIGGGSRKNTKRSSSGSKRSSSASNSSSSTLSSSPTPAAAQSQDPQQNRIRVYPKVDHQETPMMDISGSFSSLLTSNDQFGSLVEGLNPDGSGLKLMQMGGFGENVVDASGHGLNSDPGLEAQSNENNNPESFMGLHNGDSNCWNGNNGWPDLAIYTPGSSFQ